MRCTVLDIASELFTRQVYLALPDYLREYVDYSVYRLIDPRVGRPERKDAVLNHDCILQAQWDCNCTDVLYGVLAAARRTARQTVLEDGHFFSDYVTLAAAIRHRAMKCYGGGGQLRALAQRVADDSDIVHVYM